MTRKRAAKTPRILSSQAMKILTTYLVGRTGIRYFDEDHDELVCRAAASLRPSIADRDLLHMRGCGRRTTREIQNALALFEPPPRAPADWTHLDVTFKLRVTQEAESYMLTSLREALDHLLACKPLMGALVVSSVEVHKVVKEGP